MILEMIEIKNNIKRKFEIEKDYENARKYLINIFHSNKIIYCSEIKDIFKLSYDDQEELYFWQERQIKKLVSKNLL